MQFAAEVLYWWLWCSSYVYCGQVALKGRQAASSALLLQPVCCHLLSHNSPYSHTAGGPIPTSCCTRTPNPPQWASRTGIDVRIISDCNSVFISHILTGARVNSCVREVITNFSSFQRVEDALQPQQQQEEGGSHPGSWLQRAFGGSSSVSHKAEPAKAASQRLVITPRHDYHHSHHGCPLCPENL